MDNINPQAKDEVRELLNDLVVSPVSQDFEDQLNNVMMQLSELKKDQIQLSTLRGFVTSELKKVDDNVGYKFDQGIQSFESDLKTIKQKTDGLKDTIKEQYQEQLLTLLDLKKLSEEFTPKLDVVSKGILGCESNFKTIEQKTDDLLKKIDTIKEQITITEKSIDVTIDNRFKILTDDIVACKSACENIIQQIEKSEQYIDNKFDNLRSLINPNEQFGIVENNLSVQIQKVLLDIDNRFQTLTNSLNIINDSFMNKSRETSEYHLRQYKQNKKTSLIIIVLSVINMLGLIGMFFFFVIK